MVPLLHEAVGGAPGECRFRASRRSGREIGLFRLGQRLLLWVGECPTGENPGTSSTTPVPPFIFVTNLSKSLKRMRLIDHHTAVAWELISLRCPGRNLATRAGVLPVR